MKNQLYDANESNVNRMWQIEAQRTFHIRNLNTIYKEKQTLKQKSQRQLQHRDRLIETIQKNKEFSSLRKNKSFQDKVDYENSILKNKLLVVMGKRKASTSMYSVDKGNHYKNLKNSELQRQNDKLKERLQLIKNDKKDKQRLQQHKKKLDEYLEMIQKKSQRKKNYLKTLSKKKDQNVLNLN